MSNKPIRDFNPVFLRKTSKKIVNSKSKNKNMKQNVIMAKIDSEEVKIPIVSNDMRICIQQTRCQKKMTQAELANKCCLMKSIIESYENGTAVPKKSELVKINRALGLNLQMPRFETIEQVNNN